MNAKRTATVGGILALVAIAIVALLLMRGDNEPVVVERAPAPKTVAVVAAPTAAPAPVPAAVADTAPQVVAEPVAQEAPTVDVVPAAVAPAAISEPVLPTTGATITVIEKGTELPLAGVRVRLATSEEAAEEGAGLGGWGGFAGFGGGPPAPGQAQDPRSAVTDERGVARFADVPLDGYTIVARWGFGPQHVEERTLSVVAGKTVERTVIYPARQPFKIRLIDEADQPVANHPIEAVLMMAPFGGAAPGGGGPMDFVERFLAGAEENWERKTTDSQGYFTVLGYEGVRGAGVRSGVDEMFSSEKPDRERERRQQGDRGRDRGGWGRQGWSNPFFDRRELKLDEDLTIVVRRDVVVATGILVNAPRPRSATGYNASVRGTSTTLPSIPVLGDRFKFLALPAQRLDVTIRQAIPSGDGTRPSFEKRQEVQLPDEVGPFEFEIDFGERLEIEGIVYMPDGTPAEGITVYAQGFAEDGLAQRTANNASRRNGGGGRGGFGGDWTGGDSTEARLVSNPTDAMGRFALELPQALEYLFGTETQTLPPDAKGSDPLVAKWDALAAGLRVELHLKPSSLVWGEVVDARGDPVPDTQVNLRGPDIPFNSPDFRAYTDSEGLFELNIPPIRLSAPDPEEPPSHYVFARHPSMGGGLGQVFIDNADAPVRIRLAPFASVQLTATRGGEPARELQFSQLYSVPGFGQPISARVGGRRRSGDGRYDFQGLIKGTSSINVWMPDAEDDVRTIFVDDDSADVQSIAIDFPPLPAPDPTPAAENRRAAAGV